MTSTISIPCNKIKGGKYEKIVKHTFLNNVKRFNYLISKCDNDLQLINIINEFNILKIKDDIKCEDKYCIKFYKDKLNEYYATQSNDPVIQFSRIIREFDFNHDLLNALNYYYQNNDIYDNSYIKNIFKDTNNLSFKSIKDCENFLKLKKNSQRSNPYEYLFHSITLLTEKSHIFSIGLKNLTKPEINNKTYKTKLNKRLCKNIDKYFNLSIYSKLNLQSTLNTFNYIYNHLRSGIFVSIRKGNVELFLPFVNKNYTNDFNDITFEDEKDLKEYYNNKLNYYRKETILPKNKWWANGNIIDNEVYCVKQKGKQYMGDTYFNELRDFLNELCKSRHILDCDFFINKRDHPYLRKDLTEPYDFLYKEKKVIKEKYDYYTPILSFYYSDDFADIPLPCMEDWKLASKNIYYTSAYNGKVDDRYQNLNFNTKWDDKIEKAFFRGSATGAYVDLRNQRLKLADMDLNSDLLDAKLTSWNIRDKKVKNEPITHIKPDTFNFTASKDNFIPFLDQDKYKYILYVEGHCAANRYSLLMNLNSVILKVNSTVEADKLWFFDMLEPYVDHIPVKSDLSDLYEVINWCKNNDEECKKISQNAKKLYNKILKKENIFDYMQYICTNINKNTTDEFNKDLISNELNFNNIHKAYTTLKKENQITTLNIKDTIKDIDILMKKIKTYNIKPFTNELNDNLKNIIEINELFNDEIIEYEKIIINLIQQLYKFIN